MKRDKNGRFAPILGQIDKAKIRYWISVMPRHRVMARIMEKYDVHPLTANRWIKELTKK